MKTKSLITTAGIVAIFGFSANLAVAQYVPQAEKHRMATQGQGSQGSTSSSSSGVPTTYWNITWGAFAYDKNLGIAGGSANKGGKWSAKSAAKKDCKARGGKKCKILRAFNSLDGCIGVVKGPKKVGWNFRDTAEEAGQISKDYCESYEGKGNCQVIYTGCSPLERDRVVY
ncbi:protein of unknown function [Acinetobacter marinus]|uniref:DUF4189 domain-containing protein n=1 Tax=Acinetobacter marinus TaxID=281375 RepID=A0A1G6IG84_9GAMM|nr:DUF4189 domain-containing protein [Acinetobacter marinus]SDC05481.1 protein of unknown function [Acinetobacter marinus]